MSVNIDWWTSGPYMGLGIQPRNYEIASVLFMDIVSYSLQTIDRQTEILTLLQKAVRATNEFQLSLIEDELILLPTGDGMALVFMRDPIAPVRCALEVANSLRTHTEIKLRMGVHMGPVCRHADIKEEINVVGGGINTAQRVMDCGDAGHILLSQNVAEILDQLDEWRDCLHDLGILEVKHGFKVHLYNLCKAALGNPDLPRKIELGRGFVNPVQERALDVAIAREIAIREPTELVALLRRAESEGLKGILDSDPDFTVSPEDVRSKALTLEFPLDQKGRPSSLDLTLRIESPDFEPRSQSKLIRVPPLGDSEPFTFLLTATQLGELRINVALYAGEVTLFSRILRTSARESDRVLAEVAKAILTIPITVLVQPSYSVAAATDFVRLSAEEVNLLDRIVEQKRLEKEPGEFTRMAIPAAEASTKVKSEFENILARRPAEFPTKSTSRTPGVFTKAVESALESRESALPDAPRAVEGEPQPRIAGSIARPAQWAVTAGAIMVAIGAVFISMRRHDPQNAATSPSTQIIASSKGISDDLTANRRRQDVTAGTPPVVSSAAPRTIPPADPMVVPPPPTVIAPAAPMVVPPPAPTVAPRAAPLAKRLNKGSSEQIATNRGVAEALERFREAFENRDNERLKRVWPDLTGEELSSIQSSFRLARSIKMELVPLAEPKLSGEKAVVKCIRRMTVSDESGPMPSQDEVVEISLTRLGEAMVIESVRVVGPF